MGVEGRLAKQLKKLHRLMQRLIAQSPEFRDLRKLLREEQVELAIYVVPLINGKPMGGVDELQFQLTDSDRQFLKQAGIQF